MSSVRMCDRCGQVFSEREKGWTVYTVAQVDEQRPDRSDSTHVVVLDACVGCSPRQLQQGVPRPTLHGLGAPQAEDPLALSAPEQPTTTWDSGQPSTLPQGGVPQD